MEVTALKDRMISFLRWSERYTRIDMVYLAQGSFWLSVGYLIVTVSGLCIAVALANFIPKTVFGTYQFILSVTAVIATLTLTGMTAAVIRAVSRGMDGALRFGVYVRLTWSIAVVFAAAAIASYYYLNGNSTLALSFLVAGTLAPFIESFALARAYLLGKKLFRESALYTAVRRLTPLLTIITALYFTDDILLIILTYFTSHAVVTALLYFFVIRQYKLPFSEDREMVNLAKHLSLMRILTETVAQADKVLTYYFLGPIALATYVLAQLPVMHIRAGCRIILSLTFPKLSTLEFSAMKRRLPFLFLLYLLGAAGAVGAYILVAPYLFALLFPAYAESVLFSQVLALVALAAPRLLFSQALTIHQKKRELYSINLTQNALHLILLFTLLPLYGIWGAVWALLGMHAYSLLVTSYVFFRSPPGIARAGQELEDIELP